MSESAIDSLLAVNRALTKLRDAIESVRNLPVDAEGHKEYIDDLQTQVYQIKDQVSDAIKELSVPADKSTLVANQVHVKKHFKMTTEFGSIAADASSGHLGMWFSEKNNPDSNQLGVVISKQSGLQVLYWLPKTYFKLKPGQQRLPLAMHSGGLQVPLPTGEVRSIPWDVLLPALVEAIDKK